MIFMFLKEIKEFTRGSLETTGIKNILGVPEPQLRHFFGAGAA
jgi:hypothetical protein